MSTPLHEAARAASATSTAWDGACWNPAACVHREALARPGATALVVDGRSFSWQELASAAASVAGWIRGTARTLERGFEGEGRPRAPRVGVLASRSFETFAGILGAAWAGATWVPLHPRQPPARLASVLAQSDLDAMVVDASGATNQGVGEVLGALPLLLADGAQLRGANGAGTRLSALASVDASSSPPVAVAPGHVAYVIFTSGTTGTPKGVMVGASALRHFLDRVRELYAIGPGDRVGHFAEPSFDLSVMEIFAALDGGASLHVVPEAELLAPAGFLRRERLTVWASVPSVISILQRMKLLAPGCFPSLRVSVFIGEALGVGAAKAWRDAAPASVVDNHYGPTEATVACTRQRVEEPVAETPGRGIVPIGLPYDGMRAEVVDAGGRFLPDGEEGELVLNGPQLAEGYLGDEDRSAERFVALDHPVLGVSRWYRSGDLAVRDADGCLHFLGRVDDQVKVLGHRVELGDVEAHLRTAAACDEVAAVAWEGPSRGDAAGLRAATSIVGFVCTPSRSAAEIRESLRASLPPYMVPRRVVTVDALPRTTNGKVDRRALARLLEVDA